MKRTAMKRRTPLRRRVPLARGERPLQRKKGMNRVSARGRREQAAWRRRKAEQTERPCELRELSACWGPLTWHHRIPRGMGGTRNDTSPLARLCAGHHEYVERNRKWAREQGWLLRRAA